MPPPFAGEDEEAGEPSVAIGDHATDADRDADAKEHEESKRLLYVALTRARDRLYLGATAADQRVPTAKGSLGRVLPDSLLSVLTRTSDRDGTVMWAGAAESHLLRRLSAPGGEPRRWRRQASEQVRRDDFVPLPPSGRVRDEESDDGESTAFDLPVSELAADGRVIRRVFDARNWPIRIAKGQPIP
jgi:ATP-dependent exoDNAse (exonuclease V) beta subunit